MSGMKDFPDTPVLIEFKPNAVYNRVEEMVAQTGEILSRPTSQQNCIGIMGMLTPGLGYVHAQLPALPLSHCESVRELTPPQSRAEAEDRLYRLAFLTAGWAAGYNPEDTMVNRTFYEYARMRGLTLFPWSRSWTLAPSVWEKNGQRCDQTWTHTEVQTELLVLEGELNSHADGSYSADRAGTVKVMLMQVLELHFGDCYRIFSEPLCLRFS